jgi:hypothetical protein
VVEQEEEEEEEIPPGVTTKQWMGNKILKFSRLLSNIEYRRC